MEQSSTREYSLEEIENVTNNFPISSIHTIFNEQFIVITGPFSTLQIVGDGLKEPHEIFWKEKSTLIELQLKNKNILRTSLASPFIVYSKRDYTTEAFNQLNEVING